MYCIGIVCLREVDGPVKQKLDRNMKIWICWSQSNRREARGQRYFLIHTYIYLLLCFLNRYLRDALYVFLYVISYMCMYIACGASYNFIWEMHLYILIYVISYVYVVFGIFCVCCFLFRILIPLQRIVQSRLVENPMPMRMKMWWMSCWMYWTCPLWQERSTLCFHLPLIGSSWQKYDV